MFTPSNNSTAPELIWQYNYPKVHQWETHGCKTHANKQVLYKSQFKIYNIQHVFNIGKRQMEHRPCINTALYLCIITEPNTCGHFKDITKKFYLPNFFSNSKHCSPFSTLFANSL